MPVMPIKPKGQKFPGKAAHVTKAQTRRAANKIVTKYSRLSKEDAKTESEKRGRAHTFMLNAMPYSGDNPDLIKRTIIRLRNLRGTKKVDSLKQLIINGIKNKTISPKDTLLLRHILIQAEYKSITPDIELLEFFLDPIFVELSRIENQSNHTFITFMAEHLYKRFNSEDTPEEIKEKIKDLFTRYSILDEVLGAYSP